MATRRRAGEHGGTVIERRGDRRGEPHPADDDAAAFRAAMQGVRPLPRSCTQAAPAAPVAARGTPVRIRRKSPAGPTVENLDAQMPLLERFDAPDAQLSFRRSGVRDRQLRRLRRGALPIEAELDLHGLNQAHARALLAAFLAESRERGRSCVRIIHGKGMRSGARGAVLKAAVNEWLRRHQDVLAFTSARPIDGGTGAVYLLLRA